MKVKITADGHPGGTLVRRADTGEPIDGIRSVSFEHDAGGLPRIQLELIMIPIAIEGRAQVIGGNSKPIARIIYLDGSEDNFT